MRYMGMDEWYNSCALAFLAKGQLFILPVTLFSITLTFFQPSCSRHSDLFPHFDSYQYLQCLSSGNKLIIDTVKYIDLPEEYPILQLFYTNNCKFRYEIHKTIRNRLLNDSILNTLPKDVFFNGGDGLKKSDIHKPIQSFYTIIVPADSIIYYLTWKGSAINERKIANKHLSVLKQFIQCKDTTCAKLFLDSLSILCKQDSPVNPN